jgi:hypothetical protein
VSRMGAFNDFNLSATLTNSPRLGLLAIARIVLVNRVSPAASK